MKKLLPTISLISIVALANGCTTTRNSSDLRVNLSRGMDYSARDNNVKFWSKPRRELWRRADQMKYPQLNPDLYHSR